MSKYSWPKPRVAERETVHKTYRTPDRGLCPQGHTYDVSYINHQGEPRRYCKKCDTRPHTVEGKVGLEAGYERRPCTGCGKPTLTILYHPPEEMVICSPECYAAVREAEK